MSDAVVSALVSVLVKKLASAAYGSLENLIPYNEIDASEMERLRRSLIQLQNILADASRKETTNASVRQWLIDLRHLAYDLDDLLDALATDAQAQTLTSSAACFKRFSSTRRKAWEKFNHISTKLQHLVGGDILVWLSIKKLQPLAAQLITEACKPLFSTHLPLSDAKEALVQQLLSESNQTVVPILGMGGVGKTTLARLLYDDPLVNHRFKLKAWACVSTEFDIIGITRCILSGFAPGIQQDFANLNALQLALINVMRDERVLLVLDDVWSVSFADWDTLVKPFHTCAPGSKIVITTRQGQLISMLGCSLQNRQLESLPHDEALSLLARHALGATDFDSCLSLKPLAEGIVKKCGALPLALISLGRLLRNKNDEPEHWNEILKSEIWELPAEAEIIPALLLSYQHLSAPLKQLFSYCSLFPKDYLFNKDELVLLWMAEGFLHQPTPSRSTKERLGQEYFDELFTRSFFQRAPNNNSLFVMHDLLNDLASYVAGEFFVRQGNETEEMLEKYRRMSFVRERYVTYKNFEVFERAKGLRTLLVTSVELVSVYPLSSLSNKILGDLLPKLQLLRVLSLRGFYISDVPEFIGTLKHLRYLNLSYSHITHLPESVSNLYNLETLILYGCIYLKKLPSSFLKLKKLRHLDVGVTSLDRMPLGIGELKNLQTLPNITIGGKSGFEISMFKNLENLCGKISIDGLDKVKSAIHAREAELSQKRFSVLELAWSDELNGSRNEMLEKEVLNELKPCSEHLEKLSIFSYGGLDFPDWVGNSSFQHLKSVSILNCKRFTSLPSLGHLRSLMELRIGGLDSVVVVGLELLGPVGAFHSLERLSFGWMNELRILSMNALGVFPCLKDLEISFCPKLVEVTLEDLPSLKHLRLRSCPNLTEVTFKELPSLNDVVVYECDGCVLRRLVEVAPAVKKLALNHVLGLNDLVWRGVMEYLEALEELTIVGCHEISYLWESEAIASNVLVNLRDLSVIACDNLLSLGEKEEENDNYKGKLLTSLRVLHVWSKNMERCSWPDSVERLRVQLNKSNTSVSLPMRGQKLKSLRVGGCNELLEMEWGGQKKTATEATCQYLKN